MRPLPHFILWKLGIAKPHTQVSPLEQECIRRHSRGARRIAEIGVWHGVTTVILRREMAPDGILFAIDPYPVGRLGLSLQRLIAHSEVGRVQRGEIVWLETTGVEAAREYPRLGAGPLDFVFIDGDHSYDAVKADWFGWRDHVKVGGRVALHDSRSADGREIDSSGSAIFTREVVLRDPEFEVVDTIDTLTVLQRRAV